MFNVMAAGGILLSLLSPSVTIPADGSTAPPTGQITIDHIIGKGSGCKDLNPATDIAVSPDNTAFTVIYSTFQVHGTDETPSEFCQLNMQVHVPSGFTYAVAEADYRGEASVQKGDKATMKESYYFQGMPGTARTTHPIKATSDPMGSDFEASDQVPVDALIYAPCGAERNLNIKSELGINPKNAKTSTSWAQLDSLDGSVTTEYHFSWLKCPKK